MSMHVNSEFGYGMFLDNEEAEAMAKKVFEIRGEEGDVNLKIRSEEGDVDLWDLQYFLDVSVIDRNERYDVTGIKYLTTCEEEENVEGVMFYGSKEGTVLADEAKNSCYKDIHEMANEFREEYGEYLPADFDYEGHMVLFWGTNWG